MQNKELLSEHEKRVEDNIFNIGKDDVFLQAGQKWLEFAIKHEYAQNFTWLGRPIIQLPQDTYAIQELIWTCKPDLIIETGIAHGGSLILSASILAMLDYCEAVENKQPLIPEASHRKVLGIDIDIRAHNRTAIEAHPLSHKIEMIEGSSISDDIIKQVHDVAKNHHNILIFLDSNHTHEHVLAELKAYAPLTSNSSYCVVWDSGIEDLPESFCDDRPWGKNNNPKTAVWEYLNELKQTDVRGVDGELLHFEIDKNIEHKLAVTASPDGFLKRIVNGK